MPMPQPEAEVHDLVRRRLTERSVRYTTGRQRVVTAIQLAAGPQSAQELSANGAATVPVSSLYRTLTILEDSAVIRRNHGVDGIARYELAEWLTGHHHHVVCIACGKIQDVAVSEGEEDELHAVAERLGRSVGFRVLGHVLEVEGVCPSCDM
jgi:Fur family ferric uptake transcriptional regulator